MSTAPRPSKAERRDEARAAALRLREEQQKTARRQRTVAVAALVAGLAVIAVVVAVILGQGARSPLDEVAAPAGSTESGGIPVGGDGVAGTTSGAADGATTVAVYSDFMCPVCSVFEEVNASTLEEYRERGDVVVEYHPVSILDRFAQGSEYSTRAANAAAVVADQAPEVFLDFLAALFADQPAENTPGLSDEEIAERAVAAGVPADVAATFADGQFTEWVAAATDQASQDLGQLGTPTILIDGENLGTDLQVDWRVEGALAEAIDAARS